MSNSQADFQKELLLWQVASESNDINLSIRYLEQYPSGYFNQLAEARIDELLSKAGEKKIQIKSDPLNPFSKGFVEGVGEYSIGDSYTFLKEERFKDLYEYTDTITAIDSYQVIVNNGEKSYDLLGNELKSPHPRFLNPIQFYPAEYTLGNRWKSQFGWIDNNGSPSICRIAFSITKRELRTFDLGTFNAFFVEAVGSYTGNFFGVGFVEIQYWIDPEKCYRPLEYFFRNKRANGSLGELEHIKLKSYKEKRLRLN